jgi:hypothetical protein
VGSSDHFALFLKSELKCKSYKEEKRSLDQPTAVVKR